jgi:hypothetical protein
LVKLLFVFNWTNKKKRLGMKVAMISLNGKFCLSPRAIFLLVEELERPMVLCYDFCFMFNWN